MLRAMVLRAIAFKTLHKASQYCGMEKMDQESMVSEHLRWDCNGLKTRSSSLLEFHTNLQGLPRWR